MPYLVLARKYRPKNFDEVIGQEHITELLKDAIKTKRVAHSYLFCGPRGIGKTSCARILAKSLNCSKGPTLTPCEECSSCREIAGGNSFDVLEIDGASNRGIDEIRALRENVKFAPNYGNYKIYIVDEVHMLTMEAFNALLKTLEEPPAHVKFIFATTDINKVPSTIISRCQRFDFKRIPVKANVLALQEICKKEKLSVDENALFAIAKASQGGLRDALSILDQLSAIHDREIQAADVYGMLGKVETQLLFDLADALNQRNCSAALQTLDQIIEQGKDIRQLSKDLIEHFRNLLVIKVGGKSLGKLVDYPVEIKELLLTQSQKFSMKEIIQAVDLLIGSQETARITESFRMPLEIAFAKFIGESSQRPALPAKDPGGRAQQPAEPQVLEKKPSAVSVLKNQKGEVSLPAMEGEGGEEETLGQLPRENLPETAEPESIDIEKISRAWSAITYAISRQRMSVATYLQEAHPHELKGKKLVIGFPNEFAFHKEALEDKGLRDFVEEILSEKLRTKIAVEYKIIAKVKAEAAQEEPFLKSALDAFKGKVVNKWHNE